MLYVVHMMDAKIMVKKHPTVFEIINILMIVQLSETLDFCHMG